MKTILDVRFHRCPLPVLKTRKALEGLPPGATFDRGRDRSAGAHRHGAFLRQPPAMRFSPSRRTDGVPAVRR